MTGAAAAVRLAWGLADLYNHDAAVCVGIGALSIPLAATVAVPTPKRSRLVPTTPAPSRPATEG